MTEYQGEYATEYCGCAEDKEYGYGLMNESYASYKPNTISFHIQGNTIMSFGSNL